MEQFGIIDALYEFAGKNGWLFICGDNFHQNYEATNQEYVPGLLILAADFDCSPKISGGKITSIEYTGVMALGAKVDDNDEETQANLDETYFQKYQQRLKNLMTLLSSAIIRFACDNELEVQSVNYRMDINKFDTNIDFVAASVTFID